MLFNLYDIRRTSIPYLALSTRTGNGGTGILIHTAKKNIFLDLMLEHKNNYLKDALRHQRANVKFESAKITSRAGVEIQKVLYNIDAETSIPEQSGKHKDVERSAHIRKVTDIAIQNRLLVHHPGRKMSSFPVYRSPLSLLQKNLLDWIAKHRSLFHDMYEKNK